MDTPVTEFFHTFAKRASIWVGSPWAFILAVFVVIIWTATGSLFDYSDTWQLVINTGTTIVTFLMVFLIQNSQNRDAKAIHLKLDELVHKMKGARNSLIDLEDCTDEELDRLQEQFEALRRKMRGGELHGALESSRKPS
jgi:low affinity Fe/Cu permease